MSQSYTPEFKKKMTRLHEEEKHTYKSITTKYGVAKSSISKCCSQLHKEFLTSSKVKKEYDAMKEILRLRTELEEAKRENRFLKKRRYFCKGN